MAFFNRVGNILRQTTVIKNEMSMAIFERIQCMSTKVFVGGLGQATNDTNLRDAFSEYGEVTEARVIMDKKTGRSRGFGFVTYADDLNESAWYAIHNMDQWELHGRTVTVCYANDQYANSDAYDGSDDNDEPDDFAKSA